MARLKMSFQRSNSSGKSRFDDCFAGKDGDGATNEETSVVPMMFCRKWDEKRGVLIDPVKVSPDLGALTGDGGLPFSSKERRERGWWCRYCRSFYGEIL